MPDRTKNPIFDLPAARAHGLHAALARARPENGFGVASFHFKGLDVAVVVAERLGGTESRFAQLMTVKAKSLGLQNTRFVNASGLPDTRQISTARDLALLAEAVLEDHADYYHYFSDLQFTWGGKTYKNHNELLGTVVGVDGIKTGYTRASGFNLMTSAKRDGRRVIETYRASFHIYFQEAFTFARPADVSGVHCGRTPAMLPASSLPIQQQHVKVWRFETVPYRPFLPEMLRPASVHTW